MHRYGIKTMEEIVRTNNELISFEEKGTQYIVRYLFH